MKFKSVILDFDGTIADVVELAVKCTNQLSRKYKFEKIKLNTNLRNKELRKILRENLQLRFYKIPRFLKEVKQLFRKEISTVKIFPGIKSVLKNLNKSTKIIILTSNDKDIVESILKHNKIIIPQIYTSKSLFSKKSSLKKCLKEHNLKKSQVVYVTDEIRDLKTCNKMNIKTAAVSWGFNTIESLKRYNPNYIINKPKDLLKLIK